VRTLLFLPHVARKWQAAILSDAPIYLVPRRSCDRGKAADFRMPAWSPSPPDTTVNLGAYPEAYTEEFFDSTQHPTSARQRKAESEETQSEDS